MLNIRLRRRQAPLDRHPSNWRFRRRTVRPNPLPPTIPTHFLPSCVFFVEWATHHACPARQPASLSLAALITGLLVALLLTTALYLVCGTAYNRWVLGLNGFGQIPSFSWDAFAYHANAVYAHLRSEGLGPVLRHIKAAAARKFSKVRIAGVI